MAACTSWSPTACWAPPPNSVMSAPAMNVRPSQITTTAMAPSLTALVIASKSPWRTRQLRALTGGLSMTMTEMSPASVDSISMRTDSLTAVMGPVKHPSAPPSDSDGRFAGSSDLSVGLHRLLAACERADPREDRDQAAR